MRKLCQSRTRAAPAANSPGRTARPSDPTALPPPAEAFSHRAMKEVIHRPVSIGDGGGLTAAKVPLRRSDVSIQVRSILQLHISTGRVLDGRHDTYLPRSTIGTEKYHARCDREPARGNGMARLCSLAQSGRRTGIMKCCVHSHLNLHEPVPLPYKTARARPYISCRVP